MKLSPELESYVRTLLTSLIGEDDVGYYMDFDHLIDAVNREIPPWQALASIGCHMIALIKWSPRTQGDGEECLALYWNLCGPLDSLVTHLTNTFQNALDQQSARLLLYARFALGSILMSAGKDEARAIFRQVAATPVSVRRRSVIQGPGVVTCTDDVAILKWNVAILGRKLFGDEGYFDEKLFLITEAIACAFDDDFVDALLQNSVKLLDRWCAECEEVSLRSGESEDYYLEFVCGEWTGNWFGLFAAASKVLSFCVTETDQYDKLPSECEKYSAPYLAWMFGQIAARFVVSGGHVFTTANWLDDVEFFGFVSEGVYIREESGTEAHQVSFLK